MEFGGGGEGSSSETGARLHFGFIPGYYCMATALKSNVSNVQWQVGIPSRKFDAQYVN